LGGEAIRQLAATKSSADYEAELVPGAARADLDEAMIAEYLAEREKRGHKHLGSADELLFEIGALMPADNPEPKVSSGRVRTCDRRPPAFCYSGATRRPIFRTAVWS
jgi:hypothetical protein